MDSDIVSGAGNENGFYVYSDIPMIRLPITVEMFRIMRTIMKAEFMSTAQRFPTDASVTAKAGDIVTVQGRFYSGSNILIVNALTVEFNGTGWLSA